MCNDEKKRERENETPKSSSDRTNIGDPDQPWPKSEREIAKKKRGKRKPMRMKCVAGQKVAPVVLIELKEGSPAAFLENKLRNKRPDRSGRVSCPKLEQRKGCPHCGAALVQLSRVAASNRLGFVFDCKNAVADGKSVERQVHQTFCTLVRYDFEMIGFSADDHAKSDKRTETAASSRKRNCTGQLEGSRNRQRLMLVAGGFDSATRAVEQHVVEMGIESRLNQ
jgi:hypothetical protein